MSCGKFYPSALLEPIIHVEEKVENKIDLYKALITKITKLKE